MSNFSQPNRVYVSNRYNTTGVPSNTFTNILQLPIERPHQFKIEEASVDYTWPSFSEYDNKLLIVIDGGDSHEITIDPAVYYQELDILCTDLQASIRAAIGGDWIVIFDETIMRLKITPPQGTTFSFGLINNDAYERLGFWLASLSYNHSNPVIGDHMPSLQRTHSAWISGDFANSSFSANNRTDIVCKIPVDKNFGNVLWYVNNGHDYENLYASYLSTMRFQVFDDFGRPLPINHCSLTISFKYDQSQDHSN